MRRRPYNLMDPFQFTYNYFLSDTLGNSFSFEESVIGVAFIGSNVKSVTLVNGREEKSLSVSGLAISFFGEEGTKIQFECSGDVRDLKVLLSYIPTREIDRSNQTRLIKYFPRLIEANEGVRFGSRCYMTPIMQLALDKIADNEYKAECKELLISSQITELFAHFYAHISKPNIQTLNKDAISKLYKVKEILLKSENKPPSLHELSRKMGLSTSFLKKNFKVLFGMPIYQYGLSQRLGKAYELIDKDHVSIKEAAWVAGYDSLGSFSNAFNKRYGYRPSMLKKANVE